MDETEVLTFGAGVVMKMQIIFAGLLLSELLLLVWWWHSSLWDDLSSSCSLPTPLGAASGGSECSWDGELSTCRWWCRCWWWGCGKSPSPCCLLDNNVVVVVVVVVVVL